MNTSIHLIRGDFVKFEFTEERKVRRSLSLLNDLQKGL